MDNNLYKVESTLRSIAKRYKSVKYSLGLAILFLMLGVSAFSEEVVAQEAVAQQEVMTTEQIASSKENLRNSVGSLQSKIDAARAENEKGLAGLRLELIQLMEQGDQVVKSPWASWQFGANYMYNKWNGAYKGRGDKTEKYPYEGILTRSDNVYERNTSPISKGYSSLPKSSNFGSASSNNRDGVLRGYGLVRGREVQEPIVGFDVSAGVRPKQVVKGAINIADKNPIAPEQPEAISFNTPTINIAPPAAVTVTAVVPTVTAPVVNAPSPNIPNLPGTLSFSPVTPTITAPTAPTITLSTPPTITFQAGGFGQSNQAMIHGGQGIHLMNYATYAASGTATFDVANTSSTLSSGSVAYDPGNLGSLGYTIVNPAGTITTGDTMSAGMNAVISHVVPIDVAMTGNYVLNSTAGRNILFISVNPYEYHRTAADKKFSFQGNVTLNSNGGSSVVGIEHQLLNGGGGGGVSPNHQVSTIVENTGTITLGTGQNMIGMMLDTEYFGNPAYYKFAKAPQTNNMGKIVISKTATNSVGFDYGYYVTGSSNEGPNGTVKVGTITIDGDSNYGYRQKYYSGTSNYYDAMGTVDGSNGVITLNGNSNVGYSIAQGKTSGDPISNLVNMQVTVDGKNNVGFLRNSDTAAGLNTNAITLNATKLGTTFNFGTTAIGGALIRSDIHEVILDKDITVGATGIQNSLMQAGNDGKVTLASGKKITSTTANEFYGMTAGNFAGADAKKAIAKNNGELNIGGNKSLGMAIDVDDEGINNGKINFSGTLGSGVYNTGTFTSNSGSEINISGQNSIGAFNGGTNGNLTIANGAKIQGTVDNTTGIYGTDGTATNNGTITMTADSVKGLVAGGANAKVINNKTVTVTGKGAVGAASLEGTITAAAGSITADGTSGIALYTGGTVGGTINANGGTIDAKNGAINVFADKGTINFNGATINTGANSLAFI
ncbi:autotransporter-associated N-terminal domain-containing protein, partial [Fusobacterium polymorphum]|uniref:autotransporter-associated N-terminal domain-containing protein n=1 Tax=Fusobacterium nucleatum subsp. polymorphum TaxID=76857 RepID=UPI003008BC45